MILLSDGKVGANELALGGKYFEEVAQHWSNKIWTFLEALKSASAERIEKLSASEDTSGSSREWKVSSLHTFPRGIGAFFACFESGSY